MVLMEMGGDPLAQDAHGLTPIDWAAANEQVET
jgi:ankyrin repeat protein